MKKMIPTLLAALAVAALSTPTPAFAAPAPEPGESDADYIFRLQVFATTLAQVNAVLEAEAVENRAAQASAASRGDDAEVARLRQELAAKDATIAAVTAERDAANRRIAELEDTVDSLGTRMAELEAQMTALLEAKTAHPVASSTPAEEPAPERTTPSDGEARLAAYRPELDESVFEETAYVRYTPKIPSPVVHPDVPWRDAGNCKRIMNITTWHMFIRVDGARFYLDESGHTTLDEVLLAPGESVGHCQGDRAITHRTAARISTAPSSERHWDGRRWVSVERSSWTLRYPGLYSQVDQIDRDGGPYFRE